MPPKIKNPDPIKTYTVEELEYNVLYKRYPETFETSYLKCFDNERGAKHYRIVWFENGRAGISPINFYTDEKFVHAQVGTQLLMEQIACTSL
jgi:phage portal protein BeeE